MKKLLVSLLLGLPASLTLAEAADVGLVNMVSPDVTYTTASNIAGKVQPFMKLRYGDRVSIPSGGQVRVVFFEGARQERWLGPASFRAGQSATESISGKAAEVVRLPAGASQHIANVPQLIQIAKLGGIQVRGVARPQKVGADQPTVLAEARSAYEKMRKDLPADDITPELYLYAALHEYRLYDEMKAIVDEMLRKQPDSEALQTLANWVRSQAPK